MEKKMKRIKSASVNKDTNLYDVQATARDTLIRVQYKL